MKAKIALATVSGRAYYKLVNELKRRSLPFWSLKPWDTIPLDAKVVITTKEERHFVKHPHTLIFDRKSDAALVVDEAIRIIEGKQIYDKVVVGVDPGKTSGVAVLGDDNVLETINCSSLDETVTTVVNGLKRFPARGNMVKIGNGAPTYAKEFLRSFDEALPKNAVIEIVSEKGTSNLENETSPRRELRDVMSAIKIARRSGRFFARKKIDEAIC